MKRLNRRYLDLKATFTISIVVCSAEEQLSDVVKATRVPVSGGVAGGVAGARLVNTYDVTQTRQFVFRSP